MKRHYAVTAVAVVLIVWLSSDVSAQPGRPSAGIKPGAKAPPKASGKPGTRKPLSKPELKPSTPPGVFLRKGGKPGLKPGGGSSPKLGLGRGFSGLKPKAGLSPVLKPGIGGGPGLKPAISPKLIAGKFPHGKPAIGPPALWHLHHHPHRPHIHAKYQSDEAVVAIPEGEVLEGSLPPGKMKMVLAWMEIHRDDLMADWELAVNGQQPFKIEPLR